MKTWPKVKPFNFSAAAVACIRREVAETLIALQHLQMGSLCSPIQTTSQSFTFLCKYILALPGVALCRLVEGPRAF